MSQKHLEYRILQLKMDNKGEVIFKNNLPVIVEKVPTERNHVMITPMDAEELNVSAHITKLWYELAPVEKPKRVKKQ